MKTAHRERRIVLIALAAAFPLRAAAQPYDLSWHTIDGGGHMVSTGGGFELGGTIGQCDAGPADTAMTGGSFSLVGGFWPGVAAACGCPGDMTGDGRRDGGDIQQFVTCLVSAGACSCADMDGMSGVTIDDVNEFVSALLTTHACP
jgi:hypothetical protein